jgi:hypothetical protein
MALIKVKFYKVLGLPSECEPNAVYFIENGNFIESYVTDIDGNPSPSSSSAMINSLIEAANLASLDELDAKQNLITTYNPDAPMASPLVFDDFLGNAIDGDWNLTTIPPGLTVTKSLCCVSGSGVPSWRLYGIEQLVTQHNDFTAICKLAHKSADTGNAHIGMYMLTANDEYLFIGLSDGCINAGVKIYALNYLDYAELSSGSLGDDQRINYLKIHVNADGDVFLYISNDGVRWVQIHSIEGTALTFYSIALGVISKGDDGTQTGCFDWVAVYSGFVDIIGG